MKITIGELRKIIRSMVSETGGGTTLPKLPMIRNAMGPEFSDREQLGRISTKDMNDEEEVSPHLREPEYSEDECWGPVPPTQENPYTLPDPYTKDYHVIPTPQVKR